MHTQHIHMYVYNTYSIYVYVCVQCMYVSADWSLHLEKRYISELKQKQGDVHSIFVILFNAVFKNT